MSWIRGFKAASSSSSEPNTPQISPRTAKRNQLQAERIQRAEHRQKLRKQLQSAKEAQEEADKAVQDLLAIEPDILAGEDTNVSESEIESLLAEDESIAIMVDFEKEDGTDGEKAMEKLSTVHCPFDQSDLDYWFSELENQLEVIEVKAQWTKRMALQKLLPLEVKAEVKTLLRLIKSQARNDIYFRLKKELLDLFGRKPEDDYIKAKSRVLTGKPSQLGKQILDDLTGGDISCPNCAKTVWAMFREQLPIVIRNHISQLKFTKDTYKEIFEKADQVWASNQAPEPNPRASVASVQEAEPEVSAVSRGRGLTRGQRRGGRQAGRGGGRGGAPTPPNTVAPSATASTKPKGTRHATAKGKDEALCKIHFNWGVNATYCAAPWKCPMKDTWKAPQ